MTSPYLRRPLRTPRQVAAELRSEASWSPDLMRLADKLDAYADDVERRSQESLSRSRRTIGVGLSVGALAAGSTAVAGAVVTQGPVVGVAAAMVATAASLQVVREALR